MTNQCFLRGVASVISKCLKHRLLIQMSASFFCKDPDSRGFRLCEAAYELCHILSSSLSSTSSSFSCFFFLTALCKTKDNKNFLASGSYRNRAWLNVAGRPECADCCSTPCTRAVGRNVPLLVQNRLVQR